MLYGLIDADERGMWQYHLGENKYNIVSKIEVLTDATNSFYAKYMEMVVFKRFFELEKVKEHLVLLNNRKDAINMSIYDNPAFFDIIKSNFEKYSAKASQIVASLNAKVAGGVSLNKQEADVKEFYEQMLNNMSDIMSAFSAD